MRSVLRGIGFLLCASFAPITAEAQQATQISRIGWLGDNAGRAPELRKDFLQGLRDLGYVEGRNFVLESRYHEGKLDRLPVLATELVALNVAVIVATSTPNALAAKEVTSTVPIVFTSGSNPVESGLVSSLARPGGNVTGLAFFTPELVGKSVEMLKQAVPKVTRVGVLWQPGERPKGDMLKGAEAAAPALGLRLQFVEARGPDDFGRAFSEMAQARAEGLAIVTSAMFLIERTRLVDLAAKNRLPAVYPWREAVEAGGLMSYGPQVPDLFRRAATYVDKILKGAKPGDLPVEQPTKFELVVNLKAARAIGLTIAPAVLARADRIIGK